MRLAVEHDSSTTRNEINSLEDTINTLLHTLIPGYTPSVPPSPPVISAPGPWIREDTDEPSVTTPEATSMLQSPSSSTSLQISSDFTDLPLTYHKVMAEGPPLADPATHVTWLTDQHQFSPASTSSPVVQKSAVSQTSLNTHPELPTSLDLVDSSLQTHPPTSADGSFQTPLGEDSSHKRVRPQAFDKPSQTSYAVKPRTADASSQTYHTRKTMMAEKSSQTPPTRKPMTAESSSQTKKSVTAESSSQTPPTRKPETAERSSQTLHSKRPMMADASSQTPLARKPMVEKYSPPMLQAGVLDVGSQNADGLPQTPPHVGDWGKSPQTPESLIPYSRPSNTSWTIPVPCLADKEAKNYRKPNGVKAQLPRVFVAVMDYDPNSLCTTGKPDLELCIHTGEICVYLYTCVCMHVCVHACVCVSAHSR